MIRYFLSRPGWSYGIKGWYAQRASDGACCFIPDRIIPYAMVIKPGTMIEV